MAKTDFLYLQGKAKWFKHQAPNKFGNWSHDLYLTDESLTKVKELKETVGETEGIKNVLKKDDDGYYITLNRPQQKMIRGKIVGFAPPEVVDKENQKLYDILIGNGSDITSKVSHYTYKKPIGTGKGSAIRWESTRIDNLVPFKSQRDFDEDQTQAVRGLAEAPAQAEF